jgi:hypothetical protein
MFPQSSPPVIEVTRSIGRLGWNSARSPCRRIDLI